MPTQHATQDQFPAMVPAPASLGFLAQYYHTGQYADLEVVSNGVERSVHKIIVCSQSPVIKHECSLGWGYRVELNQYDPETLDRVLDFCYRRTYSDDVYPETVAPFSLMMTADDVRQALEAPLAVANDARGRTLRGLCTQCSNFEREEYERETPEEDALDEEALDEEALDEDAVDEDAPEEEAQEEREDEHLPDRCEIDDSSKDNSESSDNQTPPVGTLLDPIIPKEAPKPPYPNSLFTNLKVYIAAKELQIPALQLLARERFAHSARSHWAQISDFPALIELVYLRTDNGDHLRSLLCQIVAAEYGRGQNMGFKVEARKVMARNGEFATDVLDAVLRLRSEWTDMG